MSVAGSYFHLNLVTPARDGQRAELENTMAAYSAPVHHEEDLDKIRQAVREYWCKLSRSS